MCFSTSANSYSCLSNLASTTTTKLTSSLRLPTSRIGFNDTRMPLISSPEEINYGRPLCDLKSKQTFTFPQKTKQQSKPIFNRLRCLFWAIFLFTWLLSGPPTLKTEEEEGGIGVSEVSDGRRQQRRQTRVIKLLVEKAAPKKVQKVAHFFHCFFFFIPSCRCRRRRRLLLLSNVRRTNIWTCVGLILLFWRQPPLCTWRNS